MPAVRPGNNRCRAAMFFEPRLEPFGYHLRYIQYMSPMGSSKFIETDSLRKHRWEEQ